MDDDDSEEEWEERQQAEQAAWETYWDSLTAEEQAAERKMMDDYEAPGGPHFLKKVPVWGSFPRLHEVV